jgi:hypothetical protein
LTARVWFVRIAGVALLAPLVGAGLALPGSGRALAAGMPPDLTMQPPTEVTTSTVSSDLPQLDAVACPTTVTCIAVGVTNPASTNSDALFSVGTETSGVWDWSTAVYTGSSGAEWYQGIACPSATTCLAVGTTGVNPFEGAVSVINESQGDWSLTSTTAIDGWNDIDAISCPTADQCVLMGAAQLPSTDTPGWGTLNFDGELWTSSSPTMLVTGSYVSLDCPSATECVAAGYTLSDPGQEVVDNASFANGVWSWSATTIVPPDGSGGGLLYSVSCPSATECVAAGDASQQPGVVQGLVTTGALTDGSWQWSPSLDIDPDSSGSGQIFGISCSADNHCLLVGRDYGGDAQYATGNLAGGGWTWSSLAQTEDCDAYGSGCELAVFGAAQCLNRYTCIAVGSYIALPSTSSDSSGLTKSVAASGTVQFADVSLATAVPSPPTSLQVAPGPGELSVHWKRSVVSSAGPVTGYTARGVSAAGRSSTCTTSATSCVIRGLTNGTAYEVSVVARNRVGSSNVSQTAQSVIAGTPDAPKDVKARVLKGSIDLTFKLRADNGSAITSQEATCTSSNGGGTKFKAHHGKSAAAIYISRATAGKLYTCTVAATNKRGTGPLSTPSRAVTP